MPRFRRYLLLITVLCTAPAVAQERARVDVPAVRLDQAVRILGGQAGVSIGFRESRFAAIKVRSVRGNLPADEALSRMLRDTNMRARLVAPATYLIEPRPEAFRLTFPPPPRPIVHFYPPPAAVGEEDIVVTGSKRDVPLGAYPGGVHIVNGEWLSTAQAGRGSDAIASRVASVVSTHMGPGRNKLFIRGIADSSFVGPTQATVGQYWGNSRITYSAPDPNLRLFDVGSVEVLEGPQGTLYGAGSLGGVVRILPRAPDPEVVGGAYWAGIQAVQHGDVGRDGGAIINVPLAEGRLAMRAAAYGSVEGGYIDDTGRGLRDVNRVKTHGGRVALRYDPGEGLTFDVNGLGQRIRGRDSQYAERDSGPLSRSSSIAQPYENEFWLVDLVARKEWGGLELLTALGYTGQHVDETFDAVAFTRTGGLETGGGPGSVRPEFVLTDKGEFVLSPTAAAPTAGVTQANRIHMITAETRLSRRAADGEGWLIGVSLLRNRALMARNLDKHVFETRLTGVSNRVREETFYGEGTVEPIDRVNLTLGGRLTHARLSGEAEDTAGPSSFTANSAARGARSETRLLPSAAITYRPDGALSLFARYQEGFRPGGIAVRRDFVQRFKGDRVATFEGGARLRAQDVELEASASWTDWRNIQADLIDGYGFATTTNAGDGRIVSLGLVSRWRPVIGLELDAAVYVNDTEVTERFDLAPLDGPGGAGSGVVASPADFRRLPNIADVTGRLGFAYAAPISDEADFNMNGYARYIGKSTLGIGPVLGQLQGDYVDTGVELRVGTANRGASLTVSNLLDSRGNRFALGSPFLLRDRNQTTPQQPRTIRVGFDAVF